MTKEIIGFVSEKCGIINRVFKMISSIIRGEFIVVTYRDQLTAPIIRRMLIVLTNHQDQPRRSTVVYYKDRPIFACTEVKHQLL